tara:strand:+ start:26 stop:649 length:624 start_codon:yes stop_codon:yes gene_type:complete
MALTKVRGKGLGTLGDGTASDTAIVFDGNAQDFHIGLDDSTDSLTIGLGSTLGTTSHMVFDADGHITQPLQSAASFKIASNQNNFGTAAKIAFATEHFDQNGDWNNSTYIFTAPVTGRYLITMHLTLDNLDTAATYVQFTLFTSNRNYQTTLDPDYFDSDARYFPVEMVVLADMDASDTAHWECLQSGGTAQTDILTESFGSISLQM